MGRPGIETVRVLEWMNYLSGTLHGAGFGHLFRPERFTVGKSEGVEKKARETIQECFAFAESRLKNEGWAVGEQITGVDCFLLVFWRWGVAYRFEMGKYPKYRTLMAKLVEKSAVKETLQFEGIKAML